MSLYINKHRCIYNSVYNITHIGLYAEQINGTAFTAPRCENQRRFKYISRLKFTLIEYFQSTPIN